MSAIIGDNLGQRLCTFHRCRLNILNQDGNIEVKHQGELTVEVFDTFKKEFIVNVREGNTQVTSFGVDPQTETCRMGRLLFLIAISRCSYVFQFSHIKDYEEFSRTIRNLTGGSQDSRSIFNERTEESSALQYFQFYGYLSQQQNMMQDYIRTSTYQRAIIQNITDFKDKVVLDVGAGSGILSFFAVQAGARKVYAVEASSMALHAEVLVRSNKLADRIKIITGKIEEVEIPEQVDIIISEPMGYMLFNERMLESYLHAKKFLKPQGKMFPTRGNLYCAPFMDDALYMDHFSKSNFWNQNSFYGVDVSSLMHSAAEEYFKQPIVDTFDVRILMAKPVTYTVDFNTADEEDLHKIHIPLSFMALQSGTVHGLAFWFDVAFFGSTTAVWLSTAPHEPLTHWYQVRCLLQQPLLVKTGQSLSGYVSMISNKRQSYDVEIEVCIDDTGMKSRNVLDLKNPFFCYTGAQPAQPPGTHTSSPTEAYWANINAGLPANQGWSTGVINGTVGGSSQGAMNIAPSIGAIPASVTISTSNPMVFTSAASQYPINRYLVGNQSSFAAVSSAGDFVPGHILLPQQHYPYSGYSTGK